jgi:hypothetical protein
LVGHGRLGIVEIAHMRSSTTRSFDPTH